MSVRGGGGGGGGAGGMCVREGVHVNRKQDIETRYCSGAYFCILVDNVEEFLGDHGGMFVIVRVSVLMQVVHHN